MSEEDNEKTTAFWARDGIIGVVYVNEFAKQLWQRLLIPNDMSEIAEEFKRYGRKLGDAGDPCDNYGE